MTRKIRSYESEELIVDYDGRRCIHAEECVHGLTEVFDANRKPWIDPKQAPAADIVRVIERCPTGALHYRWREGGEAEKAPTKNSLRISADGPLYFHGKLRIALGEGETIDETRAALCRCGLSKDKPFCDNSHIDAEFRDDGSFAAERVKPGASRGAETIEISPAPNGPILVRGSLDVQSPDGATAHGGVGALCRCGHSANKPFCDGSHKRMGFEAV